MQKKVSETIHFVDENNNQIYPDFRLFPLIFNYEWRGNTFYVDKEKKSFPPIPVPYIEDNLIPKVNWIKPQPIFITPENYQQDLDIEHTVVYTNKILQAQVIYVDCETHEIIDESGKAEETRRPINVEEVKEHLKRILNKGYELEESDYGWQERTLKGNLTLHFRHKQYKKVRSKIIFERINYLLDNREIFEPFEAQITFKNIGYKDAVTKKVTWKNEWFPKKGMFFDVPSPKLDGFKPDKDEIGLINISADSKDYNFEVHYHRIKQNVKRKKFQERNIVSQPVKGIKRKVESNRNISQQYLNNSKSNKQVRIVVRPVPNTKVDKNVQAYKDENQFGYKRPKLFPFQRGKQND